MRKGAALKWKVCKNSCSFFLSRQACFGEIFGVSRKNEVACSLLNMCCKLRRCCSRVCLHSRTYRPSWFSFMSGKEGLQRLFNSTVSVWCRETQTCSNRIISQSRSRISTVTGEDSTWTSGICISHCLTLLPAFCIDSGPVALDLSKRVGTGPDRQGTSHYGFLSLFFPTFCWGSFAELPVQWQWSSFSSYPFAHPRKNKKA